MRYIHGVLIILMIICAGQLPAEEGFRFALPEFDTEYTVPVSDHPPVTGINPWIDVVILLAALTAASWIALKMRSRKAMFVLMVGSLLYFGFIRKGCLCPIGSLQNVALAIMNSAYGLPAALSALFILPLLFTLFFGRTFCAGVCPLGIMQDITIVKPLKVPLWIEHVLGLLPYLFVGLAILIAVNGSGFPICRLDPYVTVFRLSGSLTMLVFSLAFIVLGMFIARPYCRYMCPYSVLLRIVSFWSRRHVTITPDQCIQCRLCEEACPFEAIRIPGKESAPEAQHRGLRRLRRLLLLLPLIAGLGIAGGYVMHPLLARTHPTVVLAEQIAAEENGTAAGETLASESFRISGQTQNELFSAASAVRGSFKTGSILVGLWMAIIIWVKLMSLSRYRAEKDYLPDRMKCVSCTRCFMKCPREHLRKQNKSSDKDTQAS